MRWSRLAAVLMSWAFVSTTGWAADKPHELTFQLYRGYVSSSEDRSTESKTLTLLWIPARHRACWISASQTNYICWADLRDYRCLTNGWNRDG